MISKNSEPEPGQANKKAASFHVNRMNKWHSPLAPRKYEAKCALVDIQVNTDPSTGSRKGQYLCLQMKARFSHPSLCVQY